MSVKPSPITQWRECRQRQGFVRVDAQVRNEDAALVRDIATTPVDPGRETETCTILRWKIAAPRSGGLKALLSSMSPVGIDFERPRDFGGNDALRLP